MDRLECDRMFLAVIETGSFTSELAAKDWAQGPDRRPS